MYSKIKIQKGWLLLLSMIILATGVMTSVATVAAQETKTDAFSSAGGRVSSTNFETAFIAGQSSPPGISESSNFRNIGGFLAIFGRVQLVPEWSVPISVNALSSMTKELPEIKNFDLNFGGHADATDGFDEGLDVATTPPGVEYYAYFSIAESPSYLSTDIRGWVSPYETDIDWTLVITNASEITSSVTWDSEAFPSEGIFTLEVVETGDKVNMRNQNSIEVTGNATILIRYRTIASVTYDFSLAQGGWYMISLPVIPEDGSLSALFPTALAAYGWDFDVQNYIWASELEPEKAYWLAIPSATTVEVWGQPVDSYSHDYSEHQGWDMTGSVFEPNPLVDDPDGSVIVTYGWDPMIQNYIFIPQEQPLQPKEGYWVAVFGIPCTVSVGGGGVIASGPAKPIAGAELEAFYEKFGSEPPSPPAFTLQDGKLISLPKDFGLSQNYPNPFNPETVIEYQLPEPGRVSLKVYTILGQEVRTLVDGEKTAGYHQVIWDGKDNAGQRMASGVYLYRIQVGEFVQIKKGILLK